MTRQEVALIKAEEEEKGKKKGKKSARGTRSPKRSAKTREKSASPEKKDDKGYGYRIIVMPLKLAVTITRGFLAVCFLAWFPVASCPWLIGLRGIQSNHMSTNAQSSVWAVPWGNYKPVSPWLGNTEYNCHDPLLAKLIKEKGHYKCGCFLFNAKHVNRKAGNNFS